MKGVSCGKLSIDRSKAPKGVATFHLVSTFGNFQFPLEGEFAGRIVAQSLMPQEQKSQRKISLLVNQTRQTVLLVQLLIPLSSSHTPKHQHKHFSQPLNARRNTADPRQDLL